MYVCVWIFKVFEKYERQKERAGEAYSAVMSIGVKTFSKLYIYIHIYSGLYIDIINIINKIKDSGDY